MQFIQTERYSFWGHFTRSIVRAILKLITRDRRRRKMQNAKTQNTPSRRVQIKAPPVQMAAWVVQTRDQGEC